MNGIKRSFVLLFSLILYWMPQGIYWYYPEELDFEVGIPMYLFQWGKEVTVERLGEYYIYSCAETIGLGMLYLRVVAYLCAIVTTVLLVEQILELVKKQTMQRAMSYTANILLVLTTVQFVCSLFYILDWFVMPDSWKWMQGITFVQLIIAKAFQTSVCKKQKYQNARINSLKNLVYVWLLCYGLFGTCFVELRNEFTDDAPKEYNKYSVFQIISTWWKDSGCGMQFLLFAFVVIALLMVFICFKNIAVLLLACIAVICILSPQIHETTWYFKPDIVYSVLLGWSCWRVVGASDRICPFSATFLFK